MDIYKQASRIGLCFSTTKGTLTVDQLWSTPQAVIATALKEVKSLMKESDGSDELAFLGESSKIAPAVQLTFDILKDVYLTKKAEAEAAVTAKEDKARREKILSLIADKKEESLKNLSVEELEKLL